jgi:hypothetical protein
MSGSGVEYIGNREVAPRMRCAVVCKIVRVLWFMCICFADSIMACVNVI